MDALKIPLSAVTGVELEVDAVVPGRDLRPEDAAELDLGDVAVKGVLQEIGDELLFRGTVSGTFLGTCDRCLEPVDAPFDVDVLWDFAPGAELDGLEEFMTSDDEDDGDFNDRLRTFEGNEIDLAGHVWEEIVLAMPTKYLCTAECRGLCPSCGVNLNTGSCTCEEAEPETNNSFAALRDMFPDLENERSEE